MARNEEKHFGRLNRLLLQKEREEYLEHHPKRPRLDSLQTPEEIIQWIPSIKADMNFYLKQSQVTCYCDQKVLELREKVNQFEKEYKAFLRRARQLSPKGLDAIPWTPRSYKSTDEDSPVTVKGEKKEFAPIHTPVLELSSSSSPEGCQSHHLETLPLNDQPLQFNFSETLADIDNNATSHLNENISSVLPDSAYCKGTSKNILGLDYDSSSDENENT